MILGPIAFLLVVSIRATPRWWGRPLPHGLNTELFFWPQSQLPCPFLGDILAGFFFQVFARLLQLISRFPSGGRISGDASGAGRFSNLTLWSVLFFPCAVLLFLWLGCYFCSSRASQSAGTCQPVFSQMYRSRRFPCPAACSASLVRLSVWTLLSFSVLPFTL